MEAKRYAWLRLKASSEEFELWGKSWRGKDSKHPCLCMMIITLCLCIKDKGLTNSWRKIQQNMITTPWMKFFYEYLLDDEQDLSVGEMLTVYFGTPNMFITLWFGFDYGTNPPQGTLII
jgi:hypothetical protein